MYQVEVCNLFVFSKMKGALEIFLSFNLLSFLFIEIGGLKGER